jgi:hypothetical protein
VSARVVVPHAEAFAAWFGALFAVWLTAGFGVRYAQAG